MSKHIHIYVGGKRTRDAAAQIKYKSYPDFPSSIKYKGITFFATGKKGTHNKTGQLSQEYRAVEEIWMRQDGTMEPD